jgi:hydrogenase large subunit
MGVAQFPWFLTKMIVPLYSGWFLSRYVPSQGEVHSEAMWDPSTWPKEARGVGFMEAPRGGLAHWIVIKDGKIDNYQAVVPSTWNAGPRTRSIPAYKRRSRAIDCHPQQPIEILRTILASIPALPVPFT